jgi:pilus assembly protein FimV
LRFWLALFEIYRLERMTAEFCELAAHFRNFHSGTDVWPKVQHIGRELDPSNPLFAAALGRLGLPVDREFDSIDENWLNAPMDFTSDVLMAELRRSLLDEYGVDSAELQRLQPAAAP